MTTTNNGITKTTARGFGRYFQRMGLDRDRAVLHAVATHPELAGMEADIRKGWNAERRGR